MDKKFDSLKNAKMGEAAWDRNLGKILLVLLVIVMLVANRTIYPLLASPSIRGSSALVPIMSFCLCGIIVSEFSLLAIWTILSPQPFYRRIQFLVTGLVALLAAWLLGFAAMMDPLESLRWLQWNVIYAFGLLPIALLAGSLPITALRFFASWQISWNDKQPTRRSISIGGLMMATAIVGSAFAAVQLPMKLNPANVVWSSVGILSALAFGFGLLAVLPCVWILLSPRRSFGLWSAVLPIVAGGTTLGGLLALRYMVRNPGWIEAWPPALIITTAVLFTAFGLGIIRLLGYRLTKAEKTAASQLVQKQAVRLTVDDSGRR